MSIWRFQQKLCNRLLSWSFFSLLFGTGMRLDQYDPLKSAGTQFLGWGVVNGLIAFFGKRAAKQRQANAEAIGIDTQDANTIAAAESRKISRILWLNTALDVVYIIGGYRLTQRTTDAEKWRGHGVGIIIQGGFLFVFDLIHALLVPKVKTKP